MEICPKIGSGKLASTSETEPVKTHFVLVILGATRVGKTAIIQQFLHASFPADYKATVEEFHRSRYDMKDFVLTLDILDTSGTYEFPAMKRLAMNAGDAFVLVYSIDDAQSFEEMCRERELIHKERPIDVPMAVVGNKCDLEEYRAVKKELAESIVTIDWGSTFIEASAKNNTNIIQIFNELLTHAYAPGVLSISLEQRRQSLPCCSVSPKEKRDSTPKRHSCVVS
ncbi:ras-related protein Rap-1-like [Limulus polyphemus]|uniref:Ras-related protein Rap-1-like n=1 Tax=Limulus polyphemus TaxID=6850 RepID=A0ABM1T0X8_LIMPO|nr:ras-related protein Rap-1-like [Limulus polyphemus]XP_022249534.1 ras-related protein Rap-1-like [Limulus polyphemus]